MGAVTTPRTVSEAKYAYWHTIVDLARESGIPKVEWCRSNCISIKTFNHFEGIFERQARRASYYNGGYSQNRAREEEEAAAAGSSEGATTPKTDRIERSDRNQEVLDQKALVVGAVQTDVERIAPEQPNREGADPEGYFEIPMFGDRYYIREDPDGNQKIERRTETESGSDTVAETKTEAVIEAGSANAGHEVMLHSPSADTTEGITIEADGFKLTIGANVSEESLRSILKVVQGNA